MGAPPGPVRPDCEEFETAVSRLDGADGLRADADDVPLAKLVDLVVKPDSARPVDDYVRLFLLAMAVRNR